MSPAKAKAAKAEKTEKVEKVAKAPVEKTEKAAKAPAEKDAKPAAKKVVDIKDAPQGKDNKSPNGSQLSQEKLISVLLAPHITEKTSLAMQDTNTYSFRVRRDSTKPDIKAAVELMFNVKVAGVQVVNETGKTRRFGKLMGRTQDIKKAYVRLAPGQTIDYEAKIKA
jgi:large subunit ribosomal protein L23